jgi:hypothetical protein
MANETKLGHITHYFGKIMVAAIELQIEHAEVPKATKGQSIGIRVSQHARVGDEVFRVIE